MTAGTNDPDPWAGAEAEVDDGAWEDLSRVIHQFVVGEVLEGTVVGSEPFTEGRFKEKSLRWHLDRLDGVRVSFIAGMGFDHLMELRQVVPGDYVRIVLLGKKALPDGREVKEWSLKRRTRPPEAKKGGSPTPF